MEKQERIREMLAPYAPDCGVVSYQEILPLLECRAKMRLPQNAASVIVCIFPYCVPEQKERNLSRYAIVEDYHTVAVERLKKGCEMLAETYPGYEFVPFADNSPIREVEAAVRAGLGVRGKNHLLLHYRYGSYVFIGEIVTDLPIETDSKEEKCIGCNRCRQACPGGAITEAGIDRERCISHITQKKGALTAEEEELVRAGGLLWGCDICQEVCPYNCDLPVTPIAEFRENIIANLPHERIEELVKNRAFGFRGSGVLKRNYALLYGNKDDIES